MKISRAIISLILFVWYLSLPPSAAQPVEQAKATLTVGQAEALAMRLANMMSREAGYDGVMISHPIQKNIYMNDYKDAPFTTNRPTRDPNTKQETITIGKDTLVSNTFTNGRWIFTFTSVALRDHARATVELASDGSTNLVTMTRKRVHHLE